MKPLTLDEILTAINGRPLSEITPGTVTGVSIDSRTVASADIFFAIKGERFDGHDYVGEALEKGASWAVVSSSERFADSAFRSRVISVVDTVAAWAGSAPIIGVKSPPMLSRSPAATAKPPQKR